MATSIRGYVEQPEVNLQLVNDNKFFEEVILRKIDALINDDEHKYDKRWLSIAKAQIEQGFMALNRAIMQPQRIELPNQPQPAAPFELNTSVSSC